MVLKYELEGGFDSEEVKVARAEEILKTYQRLAYERMVLFSHFEPSFCDVCGAELGPIPEDNNHHIGACRPDMSFEHFCGAHCPTCSRR